MLRVAVSTLVLFAVAWADDTAQAQEVIPADIGVTLTAEPSTGLVPGQPIHLTISVTNYGPGATNDLVLQSSTFFREFGGFVSDPAECYLFATVADAVPTPYYYLNWEIANVLAFPGSLPFAAGETRTCHLQTTLSREAPAYLQFSFGVPSYFIDLNQSNDIATVVLQQRPKPVPVLSGAATIVLVSLFLLGAAARRSRVAA